MSGLKAQKIMKTEKNNRTKGQGNTADPVGESIPMSSPDITDLERGGREGDADLASEHGSGSSGI